MHRSQKEGELIHDDLSEAGVQHMGMIKVYCLAIIIACLCGLVYAIRLEEWILTALAATISLVSYSIIKHIDKMHRQHAIHTMSMHISHKYLVNKKKKNNNTIPGKKTAFTTFQQVMDLLKQREPLEKENVHNN